MRSFWGIMAVLLTLVGIAYIGFGVHADFEYANTIQSYWNLSVKASTLEKKSEYLNKFVTALDNAHLSGSAAQLWQTPDEDYSQNYVALKSLQQRMSEVASMNVKSFEYQQAISQITAQEQDEAHKLLHVFNAVWFRDHHPMYWGVMGAVFPIVLFVGWIFALLMFLIADDY